MLGKAYRLVFFVFLLFIMAKHHFQRNEKYYILLILALAFPVLRAFYFWSWEGIFLNELYVVKLLFPIYLFYAGYILKEDGIIERKDIDRCIVFLSWVFPLFIFLPYILKLGFRTYEYSGYSGLFFAGNEVSIVLSVMFIFHLEKLMTRVSFYSVAGVILSVVVNVLVGTKTNYLILFIAVVYVFWKKKLSVKKLAAYLGFFILAVSMSVIIRGFFWDEFFATIQRLQYNFNRWDQNILTFMFSSRNLRILPSLKRSFGSLGNLILGSGYYEHIFGEDGIKMSIEMDFFDIFCIYGAVVTFFVYRFYIGRLIKGRKSGNHIFCFAIFCMLLYSSLAGHTLFAPFPGTILAILYLRISFADKKQEGLYG